MNNFAQEIKDCAGETIRGIVISASKSGYSQGYPWNEEEINKDAHKVLTWRKAKPLLSYSYDAGYGDQDCHSIYAWTDNWIVLVSEYDGSTCVVKIPRNPVDCKPEPI